jgi:hypothetical protein
LTGTNGKANTEEWNPGPRRDLVEEVAKFVRGVEIAGEVQRGECEQGTCQHQQKEFASY